MTSSLNPTELDIIEKRRRVVLRRQALDGLSGKAFLAFLISTAYDLDPQPANKAFIFKYKSFNLSDPTKNKTHRKASQASLMGFNSGSLKS
ncbi:hypothetical protein ANABIO32_27370 [Rossellomorea marisflavi]|nr:hypothetical protein ANABIO32_27370 [Rossellomorea marisflavi]